MKLSHLCAWFDGAHAFEEVTQPDYPPESRSIPKADYKLVHQAVAYAVNEGQLWLVLGNESGYKKRFPHCNWMPMLFCSSISCDRPYANAPSEVRDEPSKH